MPSLKCMCFDKWLHKGQISQEEYDNAIKKLDGHDKQIIADMLKPYDAESIEDLVDNAYSKGAKDFAEWIHKYLGNSNNVLYTYRQSPVGFTFVNIKSVDEILDEWKKGG